jgi:hypothetical protein
LALTWLACESASERPAQTSASQTEQPAVEAGRYQVLSEAGRFRITVRPEGGRIPVGPLHTWIVEVAMPDGTPADVRQLVFAGGMPQHGHGFETAPQVTDALGGGAFRVDGVRFHMAGDWKLRIDVAASGMADVAYVDLTVAP